MRSRIYGIETEYGLLIKDADFKLDPVQVAIRIKDHIFKSSKLGVLDQHYRANDEPPENGGFLLNAGRIYLDMGHLEYASPECFTLTDLVTYDRAGDTLIQDAVEELGWRDSIGIIKNNVDLETNATFGCHENYLVGRGFPFDERENLKLLSSFLVTRQIYCGAGRIGACNPHPFRDWEGTSGGSISTVATQHKGNQKSKKGSLGIKQEGMSPEDLQDNVNFQISQRADHIPNEFYRWVQYNRAIVNTRDEPLADPSKYRRIHLLVGDSNMSEFATAMKMGTTTLILELMEQGIANSDWILAESVEAMRSISRDQNFKWELTLRNGRHTTALELQIDMMQTAKKHLAGMNQETDWIISEWDLLLNDIPKGPEALIGRVDWATKYWMLSEFRKEENLDWHDPWLKSLDLEYHNINKDSGLYWSLERTGDAGRKTNDGAIEYAKTSPPRGTRADGRGEFVKILMGLDSKPLYLIDWIGFRLGRNEEPFLMLDPFISYKDKIKEKMRNYLKDMEQKEEQESTSHEGTY